MKVWVSVDKGVGECGRRCGHVSEDEGEGMGQRLRGAGGQLPKFGVLHPPPPCTPRPSPSSPPLHPEARLTCTPWLRICWPAAAAARTPRTLALQGGWWYSLGYKAHGMGLWGVRV